MELLQLRYFVALAEYGHVTNTARQLMISQPALSGAITRLETELGQKLFDRSGRGIVLNRAGRIFYEHVRTALNELDAGVCGVSQDAQSNAGRVTVALYSSFVWQKMLNRFLQEYPDVRLVQQAYAIGDMNIYWQQPENDIVLNTTWDEIPANWERQLLFIDPVCVNVYPDHPLAKRGSVSLTELKDERFIGMTNSAYQLHINKLCLEAGFMPNIVMECDYILRPEWVRQKVGIAFTTQLGIVNDLYAGTVPVYIDGVGTNRAVTICWNKKHRLSPSAELFRRYVLDYCNQDIQNLLV